MAKEILAGSTDQTIDVFIQDSSSTTGAGLTGLVYNSSGLTCYYRKGATGTPTALSLATQTVGGAHSDGGFVAVDGTNTPGQYRLDLSDTIVSTAGRVVIHLKGATNMAPCVVEIEVVAVNKYDGNAGGLAYLTAAVATASALATAQTDLDTITGSDGVTLATSQGNYAPSTATALATAQADLDTITGAAGVLIDTGTGTGQLSITSGVVSAQLANSVAHGGAAATLTLGNSSAGNGALNITNSSGPAIKATGGSYGMFITASAGYGVRFTGTTAGGQFLGSTTNADGVVFQGGGGTGEDVALDNSSTIDGTDISAILADTNELQGDWADGGRLDLLLDATLADTNELQGDWANGGRLDLILDELTTQGDTNESAIAVVDGNVDSILVDTAEIGTAGAGLTDLGGMSTGMKAEVNAEADTAISDAALATAANLATVDSVVDAIKVITDALGATAAARLALSGGQMVPGTVDTVTNTHTPTTTEFQADDITEATADHYNGRIVIFTSGALAGQATDITDYSAVGGIGQFTVTAMTEAPANNDTFIIV